MNILVTGGTGFVGRHLVGRLAAAGHRVVSYNRDFTARAADGVEAVQGELFDLPRLTAAIGEFGVDVIVHTAGMSHPGLSVAMPVTTFAANADGTLWVLEAARTTGVRRVVSFSSECAYGGGDARGPRRGLQHLRRHPDDAGRGGGRADRDRARRGHQHRAWAHRGLGRRRDARGSR